MMEKTIHSPKFLRQRRFLLVLPLLVLPFVSLLFWSLGGGQGRHALAEARRAGGLSQALPEAQLAAGLAAGKLGYYKQAASDSARLRELLKKDAFAFGQAAAGKQAGPDAPMAGADTPPSRKATGSSSGSGEAQLGSRQASVYRKLGQLQEALLEEPEGLPPKSSALSALPAGTAPLTGRADLARLEQLLHQRQENKGGDPELQQLNGMLEKILDIQHPQRVREKIRQASEAQQGVVFPVRVPEPGVSVSLLAEGGTTPDGSQPPADRQTGFYSWEETSHAPPDPAAIQAVVPETQTLVSGSTVKLRLTGEVFVSGRLLPKDSFVFGTASLEGERLKITIQGIRFQQSLFPVSLSVYDLDGLEGIYIPGGITREVARQSADRAVRDIGFTSINPSLELQAASAGVEAARNLLSKKTRQVKATVKAGYQVLLRDERRPSGTSWPQ